MVVAAAEVGVEEGETVVAEVVVGADTTLMFQGCSKVGTSFIEAVDSVSFMAANRSVELPSKSALNWARHASSCNPFFSLITWEKSGKA